MLTQHEPHHPLVDPFKLIHAVQGRLEAARQFRNVYAERLAPDFSPLMFMDTRENGLSRILAWLLDPGGNHAQGDRFLRKMFDWLELHEDWVAGASAMTVMTEAPTSARGRLGFIDVLVRGNDRAFAIENKPSAVDQFEQVGRYLDDLRHRYGSLHVLLYLSGDGSDPSEHSLSEAEAQQAIAKGSLKVRSYADLLAWLEECVSVCRAPSVSFMIEGLSHYVRAEFMGISDVTEANELAKQLSQSRESLEATLAIYESELPLKIGLLKKVVSDVRERSPFPILRADIGPANHSAIIIGFAPSAKIGFGVQFDRKNFGYLFYGVESSNGRALPAGLKPILRKIIGSSSSTSWWPVWNRVGPNDRFFPISQQADRDFWLACHDGRFGKMIVDYVGSIHEALSAEGLLDLTTR